MEQPRHAHEHWLNLQATAAVRMAIVEALPSAKTRRDIDNLLEHAPPGTELLLLEAHRSLALRDAAEALSKAEEIHRKLAALGVTPGYGGSNG